MLHVLGLYNKTTELNELRIKFCLRLSDVSVERISVYNIIVSPAKQKRDICTAFPAASLSSSSAAA